MLQSEDGAAGAEDSLTSTEFDRFLAERAAAAENLPTISREEKSQQGEVKKKKEDVEDVVKEELNPPPSSSSTSTDGSAPQKGSKAEKSKPEESLIEF